MSLRHSKSCIQPVKRPSKKLKKKNEPYSRNFRIIFYKDLEQKYIDKNNNKANNTGSWHQLFNSYVILETQKQCNTIRKYREKGFLLTWVVIEGYLFFLTTHSHQHNSEQRKNFFKVKTIGRKQILNVKNHLVTSFLLKGVADNINTERLKVKKPRQKEFWTGNYYTGCNNKNLFHKF